MGARKRKIIHILFTLLFVAAGLAALAVLSSRKPEAKRETPPVPVPIVQTLTVETGDRQVVVRGEGTVRPLQEIALVPQVSGKVVSASPNLVNGGAFVQGEILLKIDPADYELAATLVEARIKDGQKVLELVEQEAEAAREEWLLHHPDGPNAGTEPPPLVAKEPQLAAARAKLEAERADLRKAALNLERTILRAPFNGRVAEERVGIGQYVSPGQSLATLYSTEAAEIVVPLENEELYWFHTPGFTPGDGLGSKALVRASVAGREMTWSGRVVRTEGKLDERTRMISVVVRVDNPYAKKPPLAVGLFVAVEILGKALPGAAVLPSAALREGGIVWLVEGGTLRFRKVEVARSRGQEALIASGLKRGDIVVLTPLKAVSDGMAVRIADPLREKRS